MKLKRLITSESKYGEMIRFAMVGGFCTLLQYSIYVVFVNAVKVPAVVSTMISYAISFIANFFMTSFFTFKSGPTAKKGVGFALSHLVNMGMQTGLVAIFKGLVGPTLALLPALGICVPLNYFMVRFAFKSKLFGGGSNLSQNNKNKI
ncbi:MAG: GtrA family protein [Candidatus Amulumruptor caecigallinarius]|nr:GtrA family protein [Candidatus Amulumruptor caecigallinarius]